MDLWCGSFDWSDWKIKGWKCSIQPHWLQEAWHVLREKQWIDWMAVLTVIRRRGSLLTKTALTCASASGCVETACAGCTVHSCHFAVTDGDLVRVGFIAVRRKANYISHYNLLQQVYKHAKSKPERKWSLEMHLRLILISDVNRTI